MPMAECPRRPFDTQRSQYASIGELASEWSFRRPDGALIGPARAHVAIDSPEIASSDCIVCCAALILRIRYLILHGRQLACMPMNDIIMYCRQRARTLYRSFSLCFFVPPSPSIAHIAAGRSSAEGDGLLLLLRKLSCDQAFCFCCLALPSIR